MKRSRRSRNGLESSTHAGGATGPARAPSGGELGSSAPGVDRARAAAVALLVVGAALRLILAWRNPPVNAYDDHFEPLFLLLRDAAIPDKLACWQCYHPPVLYVLAAGVAKALLWLGASTDGVQKGVQLFSCGLGIGTLVLVWLTLERLPLGPVARLAALAFACFLPRHVYMSAMFTNDAAAAFFEAAAVLCVVRGWVWQAALAASLAIFTKYTAFAVLPFIAVALPPRRAAAALALPLALLGISAAHNLERYGRALPNNGALSLYREVGRADYTSFAPWRFVEHPLLGDDRTSVLTIVDAGMWFDVEPHYLIFRGDLADWARRYQALREDTPLPEPPVPTVTLRIGSALELVGVVLLAVAAAGAWAVRRDRMGLSFLALAASSLAGVLYLVHGMPDFHAPYWTAMKASYLLPSLPAMAALVGYGAEATRAGRRVAIGSAALLAALVVLHLALL